MSPRIRDYGIIPGRLPTGPRNRITDVAGVRVGHCTLRQGAINTGVTVILPGPDNPFANRYTAAAYVHNGFGKTCGLMQVQELGSLETPIALTNTLNVGKVADALVAYTCLLYTSTTFLLINAPFPAETIRVRSNVCRYISPAKT